MMSDTDDRKKHPGRNDHGTVGGTDAEIAGRLLAVAKPKTDLTRDAALLDRILAAAERTPRLAPVSKVQHAMHPDVPVDSRPAASVQPDRQTAARPETTRPETTRPGVMLPVPARWTVRRDVWAAVSTLAASLVIGFVAGQTSLPHAAVHTMAEASGVSLTSAPIDIARMLASAELGDDD
jgi:hypothetical protein